ncbi:MAG: AsmA family protein, partial [Gammaproteobacteria bacterium]|nr:AsmA family protein [Gammaproteobacteria bacterium]
TAVNEDLSIKSSLFRITGNGQADLANDSLDYLLEVAVVQSSKGQGGKDLEELAGWTIPVRVSGSLGAPKYKIDAQALLTTALQKEVDADKDEIKKKLADKLEEKLGDKGLDEELREKLNKKLDNFFK